MQQAGPGTHQLRQAVHFASVCQDFRAAALAPGFWTPAPQLRLHWTLAGTAVSRLLSAWAPCFQSVVLHGAYHGGKRSPGAFLTLNRLEHDVRRVFIWVVTSQQQGDAHVLTTCLTLAHNVGADSLRVVCDAMSPADVQLLAGLRPAALLLICYSSFHLFAMPAIGETRAIFMGATLRRPAPSTPFHVSWQAMTAARCSKFIFKAPAAVHNYSGEPLRNNSVQVDMGKRHLVQGLPLEAMRASRDGWRVQQACSDSDEHFMKGS